MNLRAFPFLLSILVLCALSSAQGQTVYVTKTGKKYHLDGCQYLRLSKIETTLASAKQRGYEACLVCKPPTTDENTDKRTPPKTEDPSTAKETVVDEQPIPEQKVTSRQCSGTTKAGSRCKRMTTNASGRCYQH
jgi:hypothetical protein